MRQGLEHVHEHTKNTTDEIQLIYHAQGVPKAPSSIRGAMGMSPYPFKVLHCSAGMQP